MDVFSVYALPSVSAISIKVIMFWYARRSLRLADVWFWAFLLALLGVNIAELCIFGSVTIPESRFALLSMSGYYLAAVIASTAYLGFALRLAGKLHHWAKLGIGVLSLAGVAVLVVPGWAIAGVESIGYSLTRIAGPAYWLIQLVIVSTLITSMAVLIYAAKRQANWKDSRRAVAVLIATAPVAIAVLSVVVAMQLGYRVNATVVVSFAINFLLGVLLYTEYEHRLFHFLSLVPTTSEFNLTHCAAKAAYQLEGGSLSRAVADFERALVVDALEKCGGNKSSAAQMLGISRATLRRKLEPVQVSTQGSEG